VPNPLDNVTLAGSDYTDAATIADVWNGQGGAFDIIGGSVYHSLQYPQSSQTSSGLGLSSWTEDIRLGPTSGSIPPNVSGIKFRNVDPAVPATVSARIAPPGQPTVSVASANSISIATVSMLTGIIPAAGTTPTAGTGFTYTHTNGTGVYVFTFNTPFANLPVLTLTLIGTSHNATPNVTGRATTGFTVTWAGTGGAALDVAFDLTATAAV
jgi:hypothetical protein